MKTIYRILRVLAISIIKISAFTVFNVRAVSTKQIPSLILVDRDGVVNEDVGAPGVLHSSQLILTPGAGRALGRLQRAGCNIALVTNQSCVGKGLITEEQLHEIHGKLQTMLIEEDVDAKLDHIFYCTSLRHSGDYRMKPNAGMIEEACNLFDTDPVDCIIIGDAIRDLQAAASGGVPLRVLVETGYGKGMMHGIDAPPVDGVVELIDEQFCNNIQKPLGLDEDEDAKPSILPFVYAKNLNSAVDWMLGSYVASYTDVS